MGRNDDSEPEKLHIKQGFAQLWHDHRQNRPLVLPVAGCREQLLMKMDQRAHLNSKWRFRSALRIPTEA